MADTTSKKTVEVILKVVLQAGKLLEEASSKLKDITKQEEKAADQADRHGKAQAKAAQTAKQAGEQAQDTAKDVSKLADAEEKAADSAEELGKSVKKSDNSLSGLGTSSNEVGEKVKKVGKESQKAKKEIQGVGDEAQRTGVKVKKMGTSLMDSIGSIMSDVTALAGTLGTIAMPVITYANFERAMVEVKAVSNATDAELEKLTNRAMELGSVTEFTSSQIAQGMKYLAMAGLSVEQIHESVGTVIDLSLAGGMEIGQAADIVTNILTGFGMAASELEGVGDVLVTAFTTTNSTLEEVGHALAYVGPIAAGLGAEFNDLVGAVGLLHNAGLKGTMAGTSLRSMLNTLFNPTQEAAERLRELGERIGGAGLQITDAEGNFVGFESTLKQLEAAGITATEALALFGQEAGPGMAALLGQGSKALTQLKKDLDLADAEDRAKDLAKTIGDNLVGSFRQLMSAVEGLMVRLGSKLAPTIDKLTKNITVVVSNINNWIDANPELATSITKVTGAVIALVAGMKSLQLMGSIASLLSPGVFSGAGKKAGTGFIKSFTNVISTGIKKFLPTLASMFAGGAGFVTAMGAKITAGLGTLTATLSSYFTSSIPALFAGGGSAAGLAFTAALGSTVASFFAGFKIGELLEPWISELSDPFTKLTIADHLQSAFARLDTLFKTVSTKFRTNFYILPKKALADLLGVFADWASSYVNTVKSIPGLGKLMGWAADTSGMTQALDTLTQKARQMGEELAAEEQLMRDSLATTKEINQAVIDGLIDEALIRKQAHAEEEALNARKKAMYDEIEAINKEFDPGIEKAAAEVSKLEKKFYNIQGIIRKTADTLRTSLAAAAATTSKKIASLFENISLDSAVKNLEGELSRLNRSYMTDGQELAKQIRKAENELGEARVFATLQALEESLAVTEEHASKRLKVERAAASKISKSQRGRAAEEKKVQQKITAINADTATEKKKIYQKAAQEIQAELSRSLAMEQKLADKLKSLLGLLEDAVDSIQSGQKDLERELMSPAEAYRDALREVKEVLAEGDQLAAAGNITAAVEKWKESAALAKSTANEVKSGDDTIVSKTEATRRALADMEEAEQRVAKAGLEAVRATADQLQAQKSHTDVVKKDLEDINSQMVSLDRLVQEGLDVKVTVDLQGFDRMLAEMTKDQDKLVTVSVDYDEATAALESAQLAKVEALQTRVESKFQDLTKSSEDYKKSMKGTGQVIQSEATATIDAQSKITTATDKSRQAEVSRQSAVSQSSRVVAKAASAEKSANASRLSSARSFAAKMKKTNADIYDTSEAQQKEERRHNSFLDSLQGLWKSHGKKVKKIWEESASKKEAIEKSLTDFLKDQNEDREKDEATSAKTKENIEREAADKIRGIRQRSMSDSEKEADNREEYNRAIREGSDMVEEGYRAAAKAIEEGDENARAAAEQQIADGEKRISQASDIAEGLKDEEQAIEGVKQAAEDLKEAEDYKSKLKELERLRLAQEKIKEAKEAEKTVEQDTKSNLQNERELYKFKLEALAKEQGIQADSYSAIVELEESRHQTEMSNLESELAQLEKKKVLYEQISQGIETGQISGADVGVPSPGGEAGTAPSVSDNVTEQVNESAEQMKQLGKVWTNVTDGISQDAAKAAEDTISEFVLATSETGKQFITTKDAIASGYSAFGNIIKTEALGPLSEIKTKSQEISETPVQLHMDAESVESTLADIGQKVTNTELVSEIDVTANIANAESQISDLEKEIPTEVPSEIPVVIKTDGVEDAQTEIQDLNKETVEVEASITLNEKNASTEINAIKTELSSLNEEKPYVEVSVSKQEFDDLVGELRKLKDHKLAILVSVKGTDDVNKLVDWLTVLENKDVEIRTSVSGDEKLFDIKTVIDNLADKTVNLVAQVTGLDSVYKLRDAINSLQNKTITITTKHVSTGDESSGYASGGSVFPRLASRFINKGSGTKDDVPAMLMKGEYVHKVSAVAKYGKRFMERVNRGLFPENVAKAYAEGGPVGNEEGTRMGPISFFSSGGMAIHTIMASLRKKLFGDIDSDTALNVGSVNVKNSVDQRAEGITSEIGKASIDRMSNVFENAVAHMATGGIIDNTRKDFDDEKQVIVNEYSQKIDEAKSAGNEELASVMAAEREDLLSIADDLKEELAELEDDYNAALADRAKQREDTLSDYKDQHDDAVESYDEAHADNTENIQETYDDSMEAETKAYDGQVRDDDKEYQDTEKDYEESSEELKKEHDKVIEDLADDFDVDAHYADTKNAFASLKNTAQEINDMAHLLELFLSDRANKEYVAADRFVFKEGISYQDIYEPNEYEWPDIEKARKMILEAGNREDDSYGSMDPGDRDGYLLELDKAEAAWYSTLSTLKELGMDDPEKYYGNEKFDSVGPTSKLRKWAEQYMKDQKDEAMNAQMESYQAEKQDMDEDWNNFSEDHSESVIDRDTQHEETVADIQETYDEDLADENTAYDKALAKEDESYGDSVTDENDAYNKDIEDYEETYKDNVAAAKERAENEVISRQEQTEAEIETANQDLENKIEDLAGEMEDTVASKGIPVDSLPKSYAPDQTIITQAVEQLRVLNMEELLKRLGRGILQFNTGGEVPHTAWSVPGKDSILAALTPGEMVIQEPVVQWLGSGFFNALNNFKIPAFNEGGIVGNIAKNISTNENAAMVKHALELNINGNVQEPLLGSQPGIERILEELAEAKMST